MKKISVVLMSMMFLASCGGESEDLHEDHDELDDVVSEEVIEEEAVVLEDKEYELNELYKLNATLEDPEAWVGEKVKVWFVLTDNIEGSGATSNGEPVFNFKTTVDEVFDGMHGGKVGILSSASFYTANTDLKMTTGDTVHAVGTFDYSGFDEPDVEVIELVNFK